MAYASVAGARLCRRTLPPGRLLNLEQEEKADRQFLMRCFEHHGPIFKVLAWDELWVCMLGLDRATRFLQENREHLQPVTLDIRNIVPRGFLRQMSGDEHRHYRRALLQGIRGENAADELPALEQVAARELAALAHAQTDTPQALDEALTRITTTMLLSIVFGALPDTPDLERLLAGYHQLGPHGLIWHPGPRQAEAFRSLQTILRQRAQNPENGRILGRIQHAQALDDTMLGNLIYMVEMGRYDTHGLLRWLTKYASEHREYLDRIRAESFATKSTDFARAFVLETLRMDQSERLVRRAESNLTFEGYHIPRGATVRLCLWESHKDEDAFPEPFRFDPDRFLRAPPDGRAFSPFGLDHHHCPFSEFSVLMGIAYLRALSQCSVVDKRADGEPIRGAYHWEPSIHFSVRIR